MKRSEFKLPELKVGTLDSLIQLSDELAKADTYGESVSRKVATYFADILDNDRAQLKEHLKLANNIDPNGKNLKGNLDQDISMVGPNLDKRQELGPNQGS